MDYGYQLLRHVIAQVFGNLRQAAQLTLLPLILPLIAGFLLVGGDFSALDFEALTSGFWFAAFAVMIGFAIAYCWAAVAWHRYVLLEEIGAGIVPPFRTTIVMAYVWRAFVVISVVILVAIAAAIAVAVVFAFTQSFAIGFLMGTGLVIGQSWLATRIGLVLPAAALGVPMRIGESWAATRPVSSQILLPLIVIALASALVQQALLLLLGQTVGMESFGMMQDQRVLTLPGHLVSGVVMWLQVLINLALMTTLYGNLLEGRQLN